MIGCCTTPPLHVGDTPSEAPSLGNAESGPGAGRRRCQERGSMPMLQHSPREGSAISKLQSFTRKASKARPTLADIVVAAAPQVMPEPHVIRDVAEVAHDWVERHLTHAQRREVSHDVQHPLAHSVCGIPVLTLARTDTIHVLESDTGSWGRL
jgi:hypothetical protein